jgi:membrane protein required for colicin V production
LTEAWTAVNQELLPGLTALDAGLLAVLLVSVLIGLWRGLVFELVSLLGWVLACWVALRFGSELGRHLSIFHASEGWRTVAGWGLAFLITLILTRIAARLLRMALAATPLTVIDRGLGAVFGLLRGLVLLLIVATLVDWASLTRAPWWQASHGAVWLVELQRGLAPLLPDDFRRPTAPAAAT